MHHYQCITINVSLSMYHYQCIAINVSLTHHYQCITNASLSMYHYQCITINVYYQCISLSMYQCTININTTIFKSICCVLKIANFVIRGLPLSCGHLVCPCCLMHNLWAKEVTYTHGLACSQALGLPYAMPNRGHQSTWMTST